MSRFDTMIHRWCASSRTLSRFAHARSRHAWQGPRLECLEDRTLLSLAGASNDQILQAYGQIPLSFQVNQGQTAAQVDFLSQGSGYTMFLTAAEAVLSLQKPAPAPAAGAVAAAAAPASDVLTSSFVGANPHPNVVGLDPLAGTSNYFIGSNPSQWHTNVASYAQVEYQNLYPGVDLVFFGNQQQLEYNYVVAPGADPSVIKLAIDGAGSMTIDGQGNLQLNTPAGDVTEDAAGRLPGDRRRPAARLGPIRARERTARSALPSVPTTTANRWSLILSLATPHILEAREKTRATASPWTPPVTPT